MVVRAAPHLSRMSNPLLLVVSRFAARSLIYKRQCLNPQTVSGDQLTGRRWSKRGWFGWYTQVPLSTSLSRGLVSMVVTGLDSG